MLLRAAWRSASHHLRTRRTPRHASLLQHITSNFSMAADGEIKVEKAHTPRDVLSIAPMMEVTDVYYRCAFQRRFGAAPGEHVMHTRRRPVRCVQVLHAPADQAHPTVH